MAAWRAGACPTPAETTLPIITSSSASGAIPARRTTSFITIAPSCGAVKLESPPKNFPVGMRTAATMTGVCSDMCWYSSGAVTLPIPLHCGAMSVKQETAFIVSRREEGGQMNRYLTYHQLAEVGGSNTNMVGTILAVALAAYGCGGNVPM